MNSNRKKRLEINKLIYMRRKFITRNWKRQVVTNSHGYWQHLYQKLEQRIPSGNQQVNWSLIIKKWKYFHFSMVFFQQIGQYQ